MEKLVYLIFQRPEVPGSDLRRALIEEAVPALRAAGAQWISVTLFEAAQGYGSHVDS